MDYRHKPTTTWVSVASRWRVRIQSRLTPGDQTSHACGADFPNAASCLRLVRALAVEAHENWLEAIRYLNMDHLKEHKKQMLQHAA
jgi:transposase-like protein